VEGSKSEGSRSEDSTGRERAPSVGSSAAPDGYSEVLILGYGNKLRGDDALGWHAVELLAVDPRVGGAEVLWRHQLTPELAVDFARAALVVLIDADANLAPGVVSTRPLEVAAGGAGASGGGSMSHHIDPESLVLLARDLYGAAQEVWIASCGPDSMEVGEGLSPVVERAMPELADAVARLVAEFGSRHGG
jgi:hydrogenase maturation protease